MRKSTVSAFLLFTMLTCATAASAATLAVSTRTYGDVKVHILGSSTGQSAVVVEKDALVAFDAFGNREDDLFYRNYIDSLAKPLVRMIISHGHDHHWQDVNAVFPNTELYSVEADAIKRESKTALNIRPLADSALVIDGVIYDFVTYGDLGAWVIKMPVQKVAIVHHLGYLGVHVPLPPLDTRLAILKGLERDGYTWFIGGHGKPAATAEFVKEVEAYNKVVTRAVAAGKDPVEAKAAIVATYPQWGGDFLLDVFLPLFYPTANNAVAQGAEVDGK